MRHISNLRQQAIQESSAYTWTMLPRSLGLKSNSAGHRAHNGWAICVEQMPTSQKVTGLRPARQSCEPAKCACDAHFTLTDRMAAALHSTQPQSKSHFPAVGRKSDMATRRLHESNYSGIPERFVLNWDNGTSVSNAAEQFSRTLPQQMDGLF